MTLSNNYFGFTLIDTDNKNSTEYFYSISKTTTSFVLKPDLVRALSPS